MKVDGTLRTITPRLSDIKPSLKYYESMPKYVYILLDGDDKVQSALNRIRERCGMPNVPKLTFSNAALDFLYVTNVVSNWREKDNGSMTYTLWKAYCQKAMNKHIPDSL